MSDPEPVIETHSYQHAHELLDALAPRGELWAGKQWIFRGHADASWELLPSVHREASWRLWSTEPFPNTEDDRVRAEQDLIKGFYMALDQAGLDQLIDKQSYDETMTGTPGAGKPTTDEWPYKRGGSEAPIVPLLALAQHYKVPTRLLDWTSVGRNAAYFAADRLEPDAENLAVWALDREFLTHTTPFGYALQCHAFTAPRASNPNLHAQAGLFTCVRLRQDVDERFRESLRPLDKLVERFFEQDFHFSKDTHDGRKTKPERRCMMHKLELPRSEVPILLRLLHDECVSALTMLPGLAGVATYLQERVRLGLRGDTSE